MMTCVPPCRQLTLQIGRRKAAQKNVEESVGAAPASASPHAFRAARPRNISLNDLLTLQTKQISSSDWFAVAQSYDPAKQSPYVSLRSKNSCLSYEVVLENRLIEIKDLAEKWQNECNAAWMFPFSSDHLISLVYYNVYRALISNVHILGLDLNLMYMDDYPSPFLPLSQSATSNIHALPPSLQPTELQKTVAHHPEWDIFPDPEIRDNMLRHESEIDDLQLCRDLIGDGNYTDMQDHDTQEKNGLIVWSEPWDPDGWEITEGFVRKWPFLLRGAVTAQKATDKWRRQRGLEPLDWDRILEIE